MNGLPRAAEELHATLETDLPENDGRQDYIRAELRTEKDGRRHVTPFPLQDSSMQRTMQRAHCLIVRPPHAKAARPGDQVPILMLDF
jgi:molybdopterin molybdotransferase